MNQQEIIEAYKEAGLTYLGMGEYYFIEYVDGHYLLGHEECEGHITALPDKLTLAALTDMALIEMGEHLFVRISNVKPHHSTRCLWYWNVDIGINSKETFQAPTRAEAVVLAYQWFVGQKG